MFDGGRGRPSTVNMLIFALQHSMFVFQIINLRRGSGKASTDGAYTAPVCQRSLRMSEGPC